ncbi:MAG: hypothetical protein WC855_05425 [Thermodesulfovibrionales bacterium]
MSKVLNLIKKKSPDFTGSHFLKRFWPNGQYLADLYIDQKLKQFALVEEEAFGLIIKSVACYSGSAIEECEVVVESAATSKSSPAIAAAAIGGLLYGLPGAIIASQLKKDKHYIIEPHNIFLGLKVGGNSPKVWKRYFWLLPAGGFDSSSRQAIARKDFDAKLQEAQDWKRLIDMIRPLS